MLRADGNRHKQRAGCRRCPGACAAPAGCGGDYSDSGGLGNAVPASTPAASERQAIIGLVTAHSSFQAPIDAPAEAAVKLAGEDYNSEGGILDRKISFIQADTKSDPAQSANAAVQLLDKGAQVLVVTCDYDTGGPAARIAQEKNVVAISLCASSPKWNTIGPLCIQHDLRLSHRRCGRRSVGAYGKLGCKTASC